MGHLFLSKHSNGSKHSKAAVLKFFGSHDIESFISLGLQAKRIKSNVAGVVAIEEDRAECLIAEILYGLENKKKKSKALETSCHGDEPLH
jgi:hypothetical protein